MSGKHRNFKQIGFWTLRGAIRDDRPYRATKTYAVRFGASVSEIAPSDRLILRSSVCDTFMSSFEAIDEALRQRASDRPRPAIDTLVFNLAVGMSVADATGKAIANLGYESVVFERPLFPGDSLYAESEVLEKRESASRLDRGIVSIGTGSYHQNHVHILVLRRSYMALKRRK